MKKSVITGVKPTGEQFHLGNLLGAILPFKKISEGNDAAIFIADLHALTSVKHAEDLKRNSFNAACAYLAVFGKDTEVIVFRQSDISLLPKLNWILNNVTPYSLMLRAHSFKDSENKGIDLNMGVFNYPILMAADIIGYDIDLVPVGQDQKQHLEMTRDIAKAFNKTYKKDIFKLPNEHIESGVAILPGIDGRKMSKSYDNFIGLFDDEKTLKKKIMSIVTDSKGVDEPKDPDSCNVFALIKVFGEQTRVTAIAEKYKAGGYGYGHAKQELLEILTEYLHPYHENYAYFQNHPQIVEEKLAAWATIMNDRMSTKMAEVREVVGL